MKDSPAFSDNLLRPVVKVGLTILMVELLLMVLFQSPYLKGVLSDAAVTLLDASLLAAVVSFVLHKFILQPMRSQQARIEQQLAELQRSQKELEAADQKIEQAHQEWVAALDVVDDPIFLHDKEGRILRCNRAYQRCAGLPFAQIIGRLYYEVFPKTHAPLACCPLALALEKAAVEVRVDDKIYDARAFAVDDAQRTSLYAVHIFEDITERKQAEETLRKSNERFDLAVKGTNDGIWDWDIKTNTNYFSPRFLELLGYGLDEVDHALVTFESFLHPEDRTWVFDRIRQHLEDEAPYNVEYRMRMKNGEYRWFQARGEALRDPSGKPVRMSGSITDISERKRVEAAFQALVGSAVSNVGAAFFHEAAGRLCAWLGAECAIVGELVDDNRVRALAMQLDGKAVAHYEYALPGTPCESATQKGYCAYPEGVQQLFPEDKDLADMGAQAYVGIPVRDTKGKVNGILCVISRHQLVLPSMAPGVFEIMGARAGTEIERQQGESKLAEQLEELRRWQDATSGREMRVLDLKREVNQLLAKAGQPPRYPSAENDPQGA